MKFVDVTLRDGGHQIGFNWPMEFVSEYIEILNQFKEIKYIELGYWKQKDKAGFGVFDYRAGCS